MVLGQKVLVSGALVLACCMLLSQNEYSGVLPLELLRPTYGEELCFARDYVIGELGQGGASEESYRYARLLAASIVSGSGTPDGLAFSEAKRLAVRERLGALGVRRWRIGGGRNEPDGAVSFLVRFLGREQSITGELYLRKAEPPAPEEAAPVVENAPAVDSAAGAEAAPAVLNTAPESAVPAAGAAAEAAPVTEAADAGAAPVTETAPADGAAVPPGAESPASGEAAVNAGPEPPLWLVDDILLENPRGLAEGKYSPGGADMTPYERFF